MWLFILLPNNWETLSSFCTFQFFRISGLIWMSRCGELGTFSYSSLKLSSMAFRTQWSDVKNVFCMQKAMKEFVRHYRKEGWGFMAIHTKMLSYKTFVFRFFFSITKLGGVYSSLVPCIFSMHKAPPQYSGPMNKIKLLPVSHLWTTFCIAKAMRSVLTTI